MRRSALPLLLGSVGTGAAVADAEAVLASGRISPLGLRRLRRDPVRSVGALCARIAAGDLVRVGRDGGLRVREPTLPPGPLAGRRQPAQAEEEVDRSDGITLGQGRLGRGDDALLESPVILVGHREGGPRTLQPVGAPDVPPGTCAWLAAAAERRGLPQ
jgi:hypothetical protein